MSKKVEGATGNQLGPELTGLSPVGRAAQLLLASLAEFYGGPFRIGDSTKPQLSEGEQ